MRLSVQKGTFYYHKSEPIFTNVSFLLEQGRIMTILGSNGIGKTTLLKCIMGFNKWISGNCFVDDMELKEIEKVDGIGFVPQAHRSVFSFSVEEMVSLGCARRVPLFGVPIKEDKTSVRSALQTVGIEKLSNRLCSQLSGGQLQLVYIARAIVSEPQLVIMDEPEAHLDFKNQYMILNLIEKLNIEKKISFLINTHCPDHALRISHNALILGKNEYVTGKAEEIINANNILSYFEVHTKIFKIPGITRPADAFVVVD